MSQAFDDDGRTLAFIGGGHMARALIGGLLARGFQAAGLRVSDPDPAQREALARDFAGITVEAGNRAAATGAATWVLAVKPQQLAAVARDLAALARAERPLVVSIAAGIRVDDVASWLDPAVPIVRAMPNRPALLGAGVTALFAAAGVDQAGRERAGRILGAVGSVAWLDDESLMDAVTAVSGSGPAYLFLLVEMLEAAARAEGLPADVARHLVVGTVHGAARMAQELGLDPAVLREQVTSRGGTTAAALDVLEQAGIRDTFARAIRAGRQRSEQLAAEFGKAPSD